MEVKKEDSPLICLPLTASKKTAVLEEVEQMKQQEPDMIELRADFLEDIGQTDKVIALVQEISESTDIPLLFTIRSEKEGGQAIELTDAEVVDLLCEIAKETSVAWIDYELHHAPQYIEKIIAITHENDKKLVMSYHNFTETPENDVLLDYFEKMASNRADYAKIAVMPQTKEDVRRLLEVTALANEQVAIPVITMSMGELGKVSRVIGWLYGSVLTFGVGVASSAPGQVQMVELATAIKAMQEINLPRLTK